MKNGKKLTRNEKEIITSEGFNPKDWLRVKKESNSMLIVNRKNGQTVNIKC